MHLQFNFFPAILLQQYMTLNTGGGVQLTSFCQDTCCEHMVHHFTSLLQGHK